MSERVQVIFRWDKSKLEQLKAWAATERLTLQEVLESLAAKFLDSPDSRKITEDNIYISNDNNVITSLITRLEQVEKTVAVLPERVAALESELGGVKRLRENTSTLRQKHPRPTQRMDSLVTDVSNAPDFDRETRSRKELGKLFNVSHEAIRIWEENGKLIELGWERIPHIKSPVKYSRANQPTVLVPPASPLD